MPFTEAQATDYCGVIGRDPIACGEAVFAAERARDVLPSTTWLRDVVDRRSFRKGFETVRYDITRNVHQVYRDQGCSAADALPDQERVVGVARIALGLAREAYALASAAHSVVSLFPEPKSAVKSGQRADRLYPDAPTDDPRAPHVWRAYLAAERLVSCVREIPDPIFREDTLRAPVMEALYELLPERVLALSNDGPLPSQARALTGHAVELLEEATGRLAIFIGSREQTIAGGPFQRALDLAQKGVFALAIALSIHAAWRWMR